jgi:hypothetical protein
MLRAAPNSKMGTSRIWATAVVYAVFLRLVACNEKPKAPAAPETGPKTFAKPEDAGSALMAAAKADDRNALLAIFGPNSAELISPAMKLRINRQSRTSPLHTKP